MNRVVPQRSTAASNPRPEAGRYLVNPATDERGRFVDTIAPAELDHVVVNARSAAEQWRAWSPQERCTAMLAWAEVIAANASDLAAMEVWETGKPLAAVLSGEVPYAIDNLRFFAGAGRSLLGTGAGQLTQGYTSMYVREPYGVVAGITPWNFPIVMAIWKAGAALAAGNAIVLKPAPHTPSATVRLGELASQAGLPEGLVGVALGSADTGKALVQHPDVHFVTFTGSTATGRSVMQQAAQSGKPVHLELGGKAPAVVFADAGISAMASALTLAATYNSGQDCTAATRIYLQEEIFDSAVAQIVDSMQAVKMGDPLDPETEIGPLTSHAHRDRVHGFVQRAAAEGAHVACGGFLPEGPGAFYPPTVIVGAAQSSEVVQEEVFGPVITVLPFSGESEGVALANDSQYGLAASVWTSDGSRGLRVAHAVRAGVTWINDHLPGSSEAPHGGLKASGFGKDLGQEAVMGMSVGRHIMIRHAETAPAVDGFRPV